jgi:DNA-binding CsgD family transcriptional regulator
MSGRKWTEREDQLLRDWYGKRTAQEIGDQLGRSLSSVHQHARLLGLHTRRDAKVIAMRRKRVRSLHGKGWSDSEVAQEIGISRRTVGAIRQHLGLPANGRNERYRKRVAAKTREQLDAAGLSTLGELRSKSMAAFVESLGWPAGLSLREAQILESLHKIGPMTQKQIAAAIGKEWRGPQRTFKSRHVPGQSYLAHLQRMGLVTRLPQAVPGKGKGRSCDLYMLALGVEPCPQTTTNSQSSNQKMPSTT